jgi:hypothetical protein
MARKMIIALFAVAAVGLASPTMASARGGGHWGHGGGFAGAGIAAGAIGLGLGLATAPYAYGGYGYPYAYDSYAYDTGGCYLVRQRVMTPYGWRLRRVQVCN